MSITNIEWADYTINFITGCTPVSCGCKNCYSSTECIHLKGLGLPKYRNGFEVTLHPEVFTQKPSFKDGDRVFVNSMSDTFHKDVPLDFILKMFEYFAKYPNVTFMLLTKRDARLLELDSQLNWLPNVWMGVSVENQKHSYRINSLKKCGAMTKFVSFEPLLSKISDIHLSGIDWAIAGGESGSKARPMHPTWAKGIKEDCDKSDTSFFFKQWGNWSEIDTIKSDDMKASARFGSLRSHTFDDGITVYKLPGKKDSLPLLNGTKYQSFPKSKTEV